jgi:hypothetical protein
VHYFTALIVRNNAGYIVTDSSSRIGITNNGEKWIPSAYMEQYVAEPEDDENYAAITP